MLAMRIVAAIAVATLLLPMAAARADRCAMGRAHVLVGGSQFGYRGGASWGHTARPFVGVANPRYATNQSVGGPIDSAGPSYHFARREFVNLSQLESLAIAAQSGRVAYASDAELMHQQEAENQPVDPEPAPDDRSPEYPGQMFRASIEHERAAASERQEAGRRTPAAPRRPPARTEAASRQVVRASLQGGGAGAFGSESASRIARNLRLSGVEF